MPVNSVVAAVTVGPGVGHGIWGVPPQPHRIVG
jgi:hypothetical protein